MELSRNLTFRTMMNSPLHINPELEAVLVEKGCLNILLGNEKFELAEKQLTVIPPYRLHGFEMYDDTEATVFMFPNTLAPEFFSMCKNKDFERLVLSPDKSTLNYIKEAVDKYKKINNHFYEKSILYTILAEFTNGNSFAQVSFDVSNVNRIVEYMYSNIQNDISLKAIASEFGISESELNEIIFRYIGVGFKDFADSMRIGRAINLLHSEGLNITEVAYESGFETPRTFNRIFLKIVGCTPSQYKKKMRGE